MKKTVNIPPHWPGMLRWLEHIAIDLTGFKPNVVAITGGADTDMYALFGEDDWDVRKFVDGEFKVAKVYSTTGESRPAYASEVLDNAYCWKRGEVIVVAGVEQS